MTASRLKVENARVVRQGRTILDVDHLEVSPSEIVAVVGPNGAGKSTLIKVLGLLIQPDGGTISVAEERVHKGRERTLRRRLACVFQSPHLLNKSVLANVELGLKLRAVPRPERQRRIEHWLSMLGLVKLVGQNARTLSGGEAQRVNLARALVLEPEVLLLDEPLGGLDAPTRHVLMDELGPLMRRGAGAGLLVTHDRRVALALGDRVAVMLNGQVRQIAPPDDVFSRPADEDVARFVGVENIFSGTADNGVVELQNGPKLRAVDRRRGPVKVCVRAEELHLGDLSASSGNWTRLNGQVAAILPRGDGFMVNVDVDGCVLCARLTRARQALLTLHTGEKVTLSVRPEAVHLVLCQS